MLEIGNEAEVVTCPDSVERLPQPDAGGIRVSIEITDHDHVARTFRKKLLDSTRRRNRLELPFLLESSCQLGRWLTNSTAPLGVSRSAIMVVHGKSEVRGVRCKSTSRTCLIGQRLAMEAP
jgi:hypothetical protein